MKLPIFLTSIAIVGMVHAETPLAFPGAEGFGAYAAGGRGGKVYHVTTLEDSDTPGTLRHAVEAKGPRTVVFDVSGTIQLKDHLSIRHPFITIAGQTAPGDGICLRDGSLKIGADDVVVRFLRVRLGDEGKGGDAISVSSGKRIIVDHCSASWSLDEVLSASTKSANLSDVTVQWCYITEALNPKNHGFGSLIRGTGGARYTFHHNLYAHNRGRNPRPGNYNTNPHDKDPEGLLLDFRNNVMYNFGGNHAGYNADKVSVTKLNYVGNVLIPGANSSDHWHAYKIGSTYNRAYFADTLMDGQMPKDPWSVVNFNNWSEDAIVTYKQSKPFNADPIETDAPQAAMDRILKWGGASLPQRDAVDQRVAQSVRDRSGAIIKSQKEVGGWPTLESAPAPKDSDGDGMPDAWESANGFDPKDAADGNADADGDGYTNLEEYLNGLVTITTRGAMMDQKEDENSVAGTVLRVDITADGRSDMRTKGWENWRPAQSDWKQTFGGIDVALRATDGGTLKTINNKALLIHGISVGADTVIAAGGLEVIVEGLKPGTHTFTGYHHALGGAQGPYTVSANGRTIDGIKPSGEATHNDALGTSFIAFDVREGQPAVIRISAEGSDSVVLNGFAINVSDPRQKALQPVPTNYDRHVDGDDGHVTLSWTPGESAVKHHVYMVAHREAAVAARRLDSADAPKVATVDMPTYTIAVSKDSLLHYFWRVDSEDAEGRITRGDTWRFRVRHLAFPTAEGYGRFAIGGRGGRVIQVTNLNDSGPGSLRAAVEATGPRTVIFEVSGLISLESKLIFRAENEYLTIAGQTAPGKGICLRNYTFGGLGAQDTIIRHMRLRLGNLTGITMDGMGLAGSDHCIVDHCSISWTIDEAFSSRGAKNITFQRSLISEALNIAGHKKYGKGSGHSFAGSIGGEIGSFHHSLLAHNAGRNWSLAGSIDQANVHAGRLDIRNMVVYNWKHRTTDGGARQVNFVNNYYKPGPASQVMTYLNPQFENPAFGPQQYYVEGNVMEGVSGPEGPLGPFKGVKPRGNQDAPVTVAKPFFEHYVKTHTAEEAFENVLADVGCNVPKLDDHDTRVIKEVRQGTTTYKGSLSGLPGIPDTQEDVGGWETYPEIHRPRDWDTDRDGMPNSWEIDNGFDPNDPSDGAADADGDGYTNLEDYLNSLSAGNVVAS